MSVRQSSVQPGDHGRSPEIHCLPTVRLHLRRCGQVPFLLEQPEGEGGGCGGYDHDPGGEEHEVGVGGDEGVFVGPDELEGEGRENQGSSERVE